MFNKICKVVIAIAVIALIGFGIFKILPGQYRNGLIQTWQSWTDDKAKQVVTVVTNVNVPQQKVTYKQLFETNSSNPSYIVKTISESAGNYEIEMNGYKVNFDLIKDDGTGENKVFTQAHLKIVVNLTYTSDTTKVNSVDVYINDELQSDHYKKEVFTRLAQNCK